MTKTLLFTIIGIIIILIVIALVFWKGSGNVVEINNDGKQAVEQVIGTEEPIVGESSSGQTAADSEIAEILSKLSQLILLPEGEDPTMATVSDVEKLKDQPFFANAKNGDKILIYEKARKAILYDPVSNKIIEVAPISMDQNSQETQ
ncbi:MAG: hypothetical protein ABH833_01600 [Parcubacteria group bacterium]